MRTVNIGSQSFERMRETNAFYVDKTSFIREWWEAGDDVTLIMRPRRFGKTLNMQMLQCFFSNQYQNRADLFDGLDIWQDEKYRKLQGSYPVIFLSFANVKKDNYADAREAIVEVIKSTFQQFRYYWQDDSKNEKKQYDFMQLSSDSSDVAISVSLNKLASYLEYRYGRKCLIFLDEYDTPLQEAYIHGFWSQMSELMRDLFNATFKNNCESIVILS